MACYADVIIDITAPTLDKSFQYRIPPEFEEKAVPGAPVRILFGNGKTPRKGYIVGVGDVPKLEPEKIRPILEVCDKELTIEDSLVRLAYWMKEHYGGSLYDSLRTVIPTRQKVKQLPKRVVRRAKSETVTKAAWQQATYKSHKAKARLLQALLSEEQLPYELVSGKLQISRATMESLEAEGLIRICEVEPESDMGAGPLVQLNAEQKAAADAVIESLGRQELFLLHGITGSGKTEVYIQVISEVIARGQQAIVLIPEIALTYQTVLRFYRCFGDRVAFVHSRMAAGERYIQSERAKKGELSVMIGPRSALFTPFPQLGLIVVDEEHETSYKSESTPRYHAVDTAIQRASMCGATVLLGSATPSVDTFYRVQKGEIRLLELHKRAKEHAELPSVSVVDMRQELKSGNRSIFSRELYESMQGCLERGEQMLLFLNRRGYTGFVSCRSCGTVIHCPHCDVSLTAHRGGTLRCHYCGHVQPGITACPTCGSKYIGGFGTGTQKIEELVKKAFPNATVLRMDADTTKGKNGHEEILTAFSEAKADILIGTQMIVKGHDFPGVTLMGVLAADLSLGAEDYRSAERTFCLLAQAAGRAGRDRLPGKVVIQTYQPEHYAVTSAAAQDYHAFYEQEMRYRKLLAYPPVRNLLQIQMGHKNDERVTAESLKIAQIVKDALEAFPGGKVLGPADATLHKANDVYRRMMYVKHENYDALVNVKNSIESWLREQTRSGLGVQFDFNP